MPLTLRISGSQTALPADRSMHVFGVGGGRIGRASDNDWVLPDRRRLLSNHHAVVRQRGGRWMITDTSSNGTFLNEDLSPLGRDNSRPLRDGDRLRIGEYEMDVGISPDSAAGTRYTGSFVTETHADQDFALATHGDLGAELDLRHLLSDPTTPPDDTPPPPSPGADAHARALQQAWIRPGAGPSTRPMPAMGALAGPVQAFFRGAGLDASPLSLEQGTAAMALAGQLLREMVLGLISSQQHRLEQKGRYHLEDTSTSLPAEQNPLRVAESVDDALKRLFGPRSARFLAPLEAVRSSFDALARHEQATQAAMQDALTEFLQRLAPEDLERQFGDALAHTSGPPPANPGERYWQMYAEFYRALAQRDREGLPHAFIEEFAKAYATASAGLREPAGRPAARHQAG